jgi:hypothetical protein
MRLSHPAPSLDTTSHDLRITGNRSGRNIVTHAVCPATHELPFEYPPAERHVPRFDG